MEAGLWDNWDGRYVHHNVGTLELRKLESLAVQTGNTALFIRLKRLHVFAVLLKSGNGAGSLTTGFE